MSRTVRTYGPFEITHIVYKISNSFFNIHETNISSSIPKNMVAGVNPISTFISKTLILDGPEHAKFNGSSLDVPIQSDSTSVLNNRYEEESEQSISSSSVQSSDTSSQEGSTSYEPYKDIGSTNVT